MWRETTLVDVVVSIVVISIHSLRVEGDIRRIIRRYIKSISIHSLRVEGDKMYDARDLIENIISIHSLRVEGDTVILAYISAFNYFNPLPPCGGRRFDNDFINLAYFNPLPPCGGRQSSGSNNSSNNANFNPLPPCGGRLLRSDLFVKA